MAHHVHVLLLNVTTQFQSISSDREHILVGLHPATTQHSKNADVDGAECPFVAFDAEPMQINTAQTCNCSAKNVKLEALHKAVQFILKKCLETTFLRCT